MGRPSTRLDLGRDNDFQVSEAYLVMYVCSFVEVSEGIVYWSSITIVIIEDGLGY